MTIKKIIEEAILNEEKSHHFYKLLAKKATRHSSQILFQSLAEEELKHKKALIELDISHLKFETTPKEIKILEKMTLTPLNEIGDLIKNLKTASKKEDAMHETYEILAKRATDEHIHHIFNNLAREELQHRNMIDNEIKRIK